MVIKKYKKQYYDLTRRMKKAKTRKALGLLLEKQKKVYKKAMRR